MTDAVVDVLSADGEVLQTIDICINGDRPGFRIRSDRLEAGFHHNLDDRLADLVDVASTVFAADGLISRGGDTRPKLGEAWRRQFHLTIPVRDPKFWQQDSVTRCLSDAIGFMSEDVVDFSFISNPEPPSRTPVLEFGAGAPVFAADRVIMFSGGLDSLTGIVETLETTTGNVILITHYAAPKRMPYPRRLCEELIQRYPGRILWIPVTATLKGYRARETTQRTRSLLFAALGFLAARLSGASHVSFFENGIVSANLPIGTQVIGSMASRTTHPQVIADLARLVDLIAPGKVAIDNPYAWLTKTEVVERLVSYGGVDLIRRTVSCSDVRGRDVLHSHCGECSQCLDRRFGILAAGAEKHDPSEMYETDVLLGERPRERSRVMALDWTRHALALADVTETEFQRSFGLELARLIKPTSDRPHWQAAQDQLALHRRHGEAVQKALGQAISAAGDLIAQQTLSETSLLRMFVSKAAGPDPIALHRAVGPEVIHAGRTIMHGSADIFPLKVTVTGSDDMPTVEIANLGIVSGADGTPVPPLRHVHKQCHDGGLPHEQFRYLSSRDLSHRLGVNSHVVRQRIRRFRLEFAELYEAIEGEPPPEPILIESGKNRGYRINPEAEFLDSD